MRYYCCGMMRSGSTWQYNMVADIIEYLSLGKRGGYCKNEKELNNKISTNESLVIKIHSPFENAINDIKKGNAKAFYIYRDLRDVAASLMIKDKMTLDELLNTEILDDLWQRHKKWISLKNIIIQKYEKMMKNSTKSVKEILAYLKKEIPIEIINQFVHNNSMDVQKKNIEKKLKLSLFKRVNKKMRSAIKKILKIIIGKKLTNKLRSSLPVNTIYNIDNRTLLLNNHFYKGEVGTWKKILKPEEAKLLDKYVIKLETNYN